MHPAIAGAPGKATAERKKKRVIATLLSMVLL
jgi:hypothetical protein